MDRNSLHEAKDFSKIIVDTLRDLIQLLPCNSPPMKNLFVSLTMPRGKKFNKKTGPIPVSTVTALTCPSTCPFNNKNGCYANSGPLAIHWRKVTSGERGMNWEEYCLKIKALPEGQLHRYAQAGDLPANEQGHLIEHLVDDLVAANRGRKGFGYTHHIPTKGINRSILSHANRNGFTINLSANNLEMADKYKKLGVAPVVVVLPSTVDGNKTKTVETPMGNKVVVCPATYRKGVTCATCQLCQKAKRSVIVGFPAHGTSKKKADKIATQDAKVIID